MTQHEFGSVMQVLESGTGTKFVPDQLEVWFSVLGDLPADALGIAVKRYLQENEYPGLPTSGKLRRMAAEALAGLPLTAEDAFARVRRALSEFGYVQPGYARRYLGEAIWQTIEGTGGWQRLCGCPPDQFHNRFAQFRDGWHRKIERLQQSARLSVDVRPTQLIDFDARKLPPPAVRLLADATRVGGDE